MFIGLKQVLWSRPFFIFLVTKFWKKKLKSGGRRGFGKFRPHPLLSSQLSDLAKASSSYPIIAFRIANGDFAPLHRF
jgi:hypothetical protein